MVYTQSMLFSRLYAYRWENIYIKKLESVMFSDVSSDQINISSPQTLTHLPVGLFLFKSHAEISQFFTSPFMMYILKTSLRSQCWCSCVRKCAVFCSHSQLSACNSLVSQLFKAAAFFGCEIVIVCLLIAKAQTSRIRNSLVL